MVQDVIWEPGDIIFFQFENEFVEKNIRCIPMIVRFKLDACGIKLKLNEWCLLSTEERNLLVYQECKSAEERVAYKRMLQTLVLDKTGQEAANLKIESIPDWSKTENIFKNLEVKAKEFDLIISVEKWQQLSNLQRFALIKLSSQNHESKNLPKALTEFGLQ
jgi:hypothetical protein